jgi:hypothetical protein
MQRKRSWDVRVFDCPEETHPAGLVIEWDHSGAHPEIKSVCCDNRKFYDLNNWDCNWSCWGEIAKSQKRKSG